MFFFHTVLNIVQFRIADVLNYITIFFNCHFVRESCSPASFPVGCFQYIGCFYGGKPFFDPIYRQIGEIPEAILHVEYILYTPSYKDKGHRLRLSNSSILNSPFDETLDTKVLIHGFLTQIQVDKDFVAMKNTLLEAEDCNVIIVDWSKNGNFPYYQATANTRGIGGITALLLSLIQINKGIDYSSVHLIGHSLGAHICGFIGQKLNNIGRITGLDPAGPFYQRGPSEVRLDKSDADFVDIIHTNGADEFAQGLGLYQNIGHQDFYPNGGNTQPNCELQAIVQENVLGLRLSSCDHTIAKAYFTASISDAIFIGIQCKSRQNFMRGKCRRERNSTIATMGYHAVPIANLTGDAIFFLPVSRLPPFGEPRNSSDSAKKVENLKIE